MGKKSTATSGVAIAKRYGGTQEHPGAHIGVPNIHLGKKIRWEVDASESAT